MQSTLSYLRYAGDTTRSFRVPDSAGKPGAGPVAATELGDVPVNFINLIDAGDPAPDFEVITLDGRRLRLSDLRGKYVVLDFWATWCGPCVRELPHLKESWEALKNDPNVVILGLSLDKTDVPVRPFVAEHGYGWSQVVLGEGSKVAKDYGVVGIPRVWMVLPDGTLVDAQADGLAEQIAGYRQTGAPATGPAVGKQ